MKKTLSILSSMGMLLTTQVFAYPVAGVNPSERPEGAPVVSDFAKGDAWYAEATKGVVAPVPDGIRLMLLDQGTWYTPFTRPGMPRYDIRDMHSTGKLVPDPAAATTQQVGYQGYQQQGWGGMYGMQQGMFMPMWGMPAMMYGMPAMMYGMPAMQMYFMPYYPQY